ncbi:MAG: beta-N-acetylhexosaminidase [Minwuia sp.]|nr:beta-N-acetylhexosaminidase [Minwuia sp.]
MKPVIFGLSGTTLTDDERALFRDANPVGFILFRRNVDTPDQVRALNESLRDLTGRADLPLLVDQEGGRVQRLQSPHWMTLPAQQSIGALPLDGAKRAAWLLGRLIAHDVIDAGFNVPCAPCLDLRQPETHDVIGDRAFSADAGRVAALGAEVISGLRAGGALPVIKHLPGHGRATSDSHLHLPVIDCGVDELKLTDFLPFRKLARQAPFAMTGHLLFPAIDETRPSTLSPVVIGEVIRMFCNFDGFLMSDDIDMKALPGSLADRALGSLDAGCDAVLQCSGDFAAMRQVVDAVPDITDQARTRLTLAMATLQRPKDFDAVTGLAELEGLLA